jgi:DNA-binding transcriptional LysR family regulator
MLPDNRIAKEVKLQSLQVFMTAAELGSMSRAAKRLNTVQPAVSRSIAELERTIGVRLFDRHRQGIQPTPYGRALLDCGAAAFDDLRRGLRNIEALASPDAGEVRIGCGPLLAASYVTAVVDHMSRRKPRVTFQVVTGYTEGLHHELSERKIDLWIERFGDIQDPRLHREHLFDDPYVIVANSRSPWCRRRKIALAELVNELWTLPQPTSVVGSYTREAFRAAGVEYPRVAVTTMSPETRFGLLATGRYLAMMPASALRFPFRRPGLKVLPIRLPIAPVPISIVTIRNRALNPTAQSFIENARAVAKSFRRSNAEIETNTSR